MPVDLSASSSMVFDPAFVLMNASATTAAFFCASLTPAAIARLASINADFSGCNLHTIFKGLSPLTWFIVTNGSSNGIV